MKKSWPLLVTLGLIWTAICWIRVGEIELKMDAMTYAALAKNILTSGDWQTLHYGSQAYANYYQHPPLAIWLQAIMFWLFGVSDPAARILPYLMGLGSIGLVYWTGKALHSRWAGFLAGMALLLSTRFIKYGADFFLDGPLAFLMLAYVVGAIRASAVLGGVALACALMTKGLVALAAPFGVTLCILLDWLGNKPRAKIGLHFLASSGAVAGLLLGTWIVLGGGASYLEHYFAQSVRSRLTGDGIISHLIPLRDGLLLYGFAPVFIYGTFFSKQKPEQRLLSASAFAVILGFCVVGHSLEHYFVPFYVLAAPVCGIGLAQWRGWTRWQSSFLKSVQIMLAVLVGASFVVPLRLHADRNAELLAALSTIEARCKGVRSILVPTDGEGFAWNAMAVIQWKTPWQTVFAKEAPSQAEPGQMLLRSETTLVPPAWTRLAIDTKDGSQQAFTIYEPTRSATCPLAGINSVTPQ